MVDNAHQASELLDDLKGRVASLENQVAFFERDYGLCYADVGRLGEALGHANVARPVSVSALMEQYIAEVAALTGRAPSPLKGRR